ncbi:MAG: pyridoxamine 5-phosphate oxidase [Bacteroidota bacterium]|jgi:pyridoxamine 5'-phosphate oxidase
MSISSIRKDYQLQSLELTDVAATPVLQFDKWWNEAVSSSIEEVNAMTLATVNPDGKPAARIVLLKGFDENGFIFFTNYLSEKGKSISAHPYASLVFFWKELERQVRIEGSCIQVSESESDEYFLSRPIGSRLGAWASPQSAVISSRTVLDQNLDRVTAQYADGIVPRPDHWGGYRVIPEMVEFWQGRPSRLHDRIRYRKDESQWLIERLAP